MDNFSICSSVSTTSEREELRLLLVLPEGPTVLDRAREVDVVEVVLALEIEEVRSCIFQAFLKIRRAGTAWNTED